MKNLQGIILAYRSSSSLGELTRHRNTCSLPFGGRYRLVDFMLSNFVNAGISDVGLIVHESYQSLLDHVGTGKDWDLSRMHGGLRILPPFGYTQRGSGEYRGTMEALSGVTAYLEKMRPDYVILAWGDIATNLPVSEIFAQHLEQGADVTVVCTPMDSGRASKNGASNYVTTGADGRVSELSLYPTGLENCYPSTETYILSKKLLLDVVNYCESHSLYSFSKDVLMPRLHELNIRPFLHSGYSAHVNSVAGYFEQSMELLKAEVRHDLFNPLRPIRTKDLPRPSTYYGPNARTSISLISDGCYIEGTVENCILSRGVVIEAGATVKNSILMQETVIEKGASVSYCITDKNVRIQSNRMLMGHATYPLTIAKNSIV